MTFRKVDYDRIAGTYDRRYVENDYSGIEAALLTFVGGPLSAPVLEAGCGTGHWLRLLAERGHRLVGLDASENMLDWARAQASGVPLVRGVAERLPLAAAAFGRVFCINAFHHFQDKVAALAEAGRVLGPGGRFMTIGLDPHNGVDRWYIYEYFEPVLEIDKRRYPASSQIREWMQALQFTEVSTREVQRLPVRLPARTALEQGRLDKGATSQLAVLTEEEYQRGISRVQAAMASAEARGETLYLEADLRVYATSGSTMA